MASTLRATTLHSSVAEILRERIASGHYPVGNKLPSIAVLQDEFSIKGLNTIRQAQQTLVDEGLLRTEQGVGAWVIAKTSARLERRRVLGALRDAQVAITDAIAYLDADPERP